MADWARETLARMSWALAVQMKGLGGWLVCMDVVGDGQCRHAAKHSGPHAPRGQVTEEPLHPVQP